MNNHNSVFYSRNEPKIEIPFGQKNRTNSTKKNTTNNSYSNSNSNNNNNSNSINNAQPNRPDSHFNRLSQESNNIQQYCDLRAKLYYLKKEKKEAQNNLQGLQGYKSKLLDICNSLNASTVVLPEEKLVLKKKIQTTTNTVNEEKIQEVMSKLNNVLFSISGDGIVKYLKEINDCRQNDAMIQESKKRKREAIEPTSLVPNSKLAPKITSFKSIVFESGSNKNENETEEFSYISYVNNLENTFYEQIQKVCSKTSETIQVNEVNNDQIQKVITQLSKQKNESFSSGSSSTSSSSSKTILLNNYSMQDHSKQDIKKTVLQYYNSVHQINEKKKEITTSEKEIQNKILEIEPSICKFLEKQTRCERKFGYPEKNNQLQKIPTSITLKYIPKKIDNAPINNNNNNNDDDDDDDEDINEGTSILKKTNKIGLKQFKIILKISMEEAFYVCLNQELHLRHKKITWELFRPILHQKLLENLHLLKEELVVPVKRVKMTPKKSYLLKAEIEE